MNHDNTDNHNVNEDRLTISRSGGVWRDDVFCGIFYRYLYHAPSLTNVDVASRSMYEKKIIQSY